MVVLPSAGLGQRHEDRLSASAGLQAEDGAAVIDKVELGVPSTADLLPFLLLLGEGVVLVLGDDWSVRGDHVLQTVLGERQELLGIAVAEVVVKDPPEPSGLSTMGDVVVFIRPFLELRVEFRVVAVAGVLQDSVEMLHIGLVQVGGSDIRSTSKPPDTSICLEVSVVEVHCGCVGVARVDDRADPACEERNFFSRLHALSDSTTLRGSN